MPTKPQFRPLVSVVDFNHARGPEIERWFGVDESYDPPTHNDWSLLPFLALPDGSHASEEELSYFTLKWNQDGHNAPTSLFGIACTRHLSSNELLHRPSDVTRSSVQKAVVAIVDSPYLFARIREKLSAVTKAWFAQKNFDNTLIIQHFYEDLVKSCNDAVEERDEYVGVSLRELVHEYKSQTLVLLKCCLLQPKMLFFGADCEKLCLMQFTLISIIPGLIRSLRDCADPQMDSYAECLKPATSLKTSERSSLLTYMGLPLQLFSRGGLLGLYTPLQRLNALIDHGTKSYIAGSTNSLLLLQKDKYCDALLNLDSKTFEVFSPSLRSALSLSAADRRWIDFITEVVNDTWDEANPNRPSNYGYAGSEEFIRLQFEEYLLALLSSLKHSQYVEKYGVDPKASTSEEPVQNDIADFGSAWVETWKGTENFRLFNQNTDSHLFDIVEPRHPCAGSLTFEDVQRRVAQQVAELHIDERLSTGREAIGKQFAIGQQKVSSTFNSIWSDVERLREAQRTRAEERKNAPSSGTDQGSEAASGIRKPDLTQAQATIQTASNRASAYLSSWGSWAAEKKAGWNRGPVPADEKSRPTPPELSREEKTVWRGSAEEKRPSSEGKPRPSETQ